MTFKPTSDGKVNVKIGGAAVAGIDNGMTSLLPLESVTGPKVIASNGILTLNNTRTRHILCRRLELGVPTPKEGAASRSYTELT